jgi:hypothetical protein
MGSVLTKAVSGVGNRDGDFPANGSGYCLGISAGEEPETSSFQCPGFWGGLHRPG